MKDEFYRHKFQEMFFLLEDKRYLQVSTAVVQICYRRVAAIHVVVGAKASQCAWLLSQ